MEEAASIARTPAKRLGLVITVKRQEDCNKIRSRKPSDGSLPIVFLGHTKYIQAHELEGIAQRYLDCPEGTLPWNAATKKKRG